MMFRKVMLVLGLIGVTLSGCRKDNDPSAEEQQLGKLTTTWKASVVTMDGAAAPGDYTSFELTLIGSPDDATFAYIVAGRPEYSPWLASGTWTFGTDVLTQLVRDKGTADELPMTYTVTGEQLTLNFVFNGDGYQSSTARVESVAGNWSFTFTKK